MKRVHRNAFTLVELLVVIGIIGVLLSILLPSLAGARQQANLLVCESNLKQIGILIQNYTSENHGLTPPAWIGDRANARDNYDVSFADTLTLMSQANKRYAKAPFWSPYLNGLQPLNANPGQQPPVLSLEPDKDLDIFHDTDTPPNGWYAHSCSYIGNVRAMGAYGLYDPLFQNSPNQLAGYRPRDIGGIKRASEVMMVWCGADVVLGPSQTGLGDTYNFGCFRTYPDGLDNYLMYWMMASNDSHGLCYPYPAQKAYLPSFYENPIALGAWLIISPTGNPASSTAGNKPLVTPSYLRNANNDINTNTRYYGLGATTPTGTVTSLGYDNNYMRFRHMHNTVGSFLYCDFHVETKRLGEVVAKDVCLNPTNQ